MEKRKRKATEFGAGWMDGWFVFMEMTEHIGIKFDKAEKCGHENVGMF